MEFIGAEAEAEGERDPARNPSSVECPKTFAVVPVQGPISGQPAAMKLSAPCSGKACAWWIVKRPAAGTMVELGECAVVRNAR